MSDGRIHKAIVAVMREIGAIGKDRENQQQKYRFRGIEDVYNRVQPLFATHGIYSYPKVIAQTREVGKSKGGGELHYAILTVEYTFVAEDGSSIQVTVVGEGMDAGDKASNKAMSAAHKYAICQVLNIPYQVIDPDANTPGWAAALKGRVTPQQILTLKKAWNAQEGGKFNAQDKNGKAVAFSTRVHEILDLAPGTFDVREPCQWEPEDYERCCEALGIEAARL